MTRSSAVETPAGAAALRAGGRVGNRRRARAPARPRRALQRFRPLRAAGARRLRRRLAEHRRSAAVQDQRDGRRDAQNHHPQRFARHFLRPLDQSLSRLRARLRLLFRAADARLSRPVAGPRLRIQAVHEAECAGIAGARTGGAGLCAESDRHRHQHRSVSADRAPPSDHAPHSRSAGERRPSGRHRDQIGVGAARSRHPRPHGQARSGQGGDLGDDA